MTPILEVSGLWKNFGPVEALRGADLTLQPGEVLALVGDNGAGKSTLIKHISGVYRPDAGKILLAGKPLNISSPREARNLGIETVYQDLALADDGEHFAGLQCEVGPPERFDRTKVFPEP